MTQELFIALLGFAFVTSATPGPNNMMLMASGANFGMRRTVPHMLGISIGFGLMVFLVGVGIGQVFRLFPVLDRVLKLVAIAYLLWLAWKLAHAAAPGEREAGAQPMSFLQAAAFQWVNPKAWAMALGATTAYAPGQTIWAFAVVALVFSLVNLPTVSLWAWAGQEMRRWLTNGRRLVIFNWTMAVLLVLSLVPVLWH